MAGSVNFMQRGYTGIEPTGDVPRLKPDLPEEPGSRYMESRYRGHTLEVDINEKERTVGACTCAEKAIKTGFKQEIYKSEQRTSKTRTM